MLLKNKYSKKGLAHIVYADMPTDRRTKLKVEVASRLIIEIYTCIKLSCSYLENLG